MSAPTVLSPWYVVQKLLRDIDNSVYGHVLYYTSQEDQDLAFQENPKRATMFTSLNGASRVAAAEGAQVRVLTTKEEADEFGRT